MGYEQISIILLLGLICAVFTYLYIKARLKIKREREILQIDFQKMKESNEEIIKTYGNLTYLENQKRELEEKLKSFEQKYNELNQTIAQAQIQARALDKEINDKRTFNSSLLKMREEELGRMMELKKEKEIERVDREVSEWEVSAQEAARKYFEIQSSSFDDQIVLKKEELQSIINTIEDYRTKVDAINAEILRARAIEEQQSFYQVQLDEHSLQDINYLLSIISNFNNKETIYKLIWSEYIQLPFKNMLKRVLGAKDPKNVIYMIKNLKTNEIYIGKTRAEVSKRWTEHIKTSLNIGSISKTNIHKALFGNWQNFSFSIIEEVPNEVNLNEREKFYIDFYKSNVYGYNIKSGG